MPLPGTKNKHICSFDINETSVLRFLSSIKPPGQRMSCSDSQKIGCCALKWCKEQPAITVAQFVIAWICFVAGYPFRSSLIQSILSKIIGPVPQVKII